MKSNFKIIETRIKEKKSEIKESEVSELFQSQDLASVSYRQAVHVNKSGIKNQEWREQLDFFPVAKMIIKGFYMA